MIPSSPSLLRGEKGDAYSTFFLRDAHVGDGGLESDEFYHLFVSSFYYRPYPVCFAWSRSDSLVVAILSVILLVRVFYSITTRTCQEGRPSSWIYGLHGSLLCCVFSVFDLEQVLDRRFI
jgi:hypothetical protein